MVDVSAGESTLFGESVPDDVRGPTAIPSSEPLADVAELGVLAEFSEYTDEIDMRFDSISGIDAFCRRAASGSG